MDSKRRKLGRKGIRMNVRNIAVVLKDRGYETYTKFTDAGTVLGIPMLDGKMLCSLIPIDDESDMRFCGFIEEEAKKYMASKGGELYRMLYPRLSPHKDGKPIDVDQMVSEGEHLMNKHRMVFLSGQITGSVDLIMGLLAMDSMSQDPIKLIITSPGGDLASALLAYDTLKMLKSPIHVYGRFCASAAVLLLVAGSKRYLSPHAKVMLHLPAGQLAGDAADWEILGREMDKYKNKMVEVLRECGVTKTRKEILRDIDRDFWLEPDEAIAYGLADEIMTPEVMGEWLHG